ncbi:MAG TPA: aminotransferase class I/II-fold pyridoxal phosphate-dependent enzyme, partial [Thermoanaerobaculia bacterium]|nr:aminotransferase class I/II-fold pyridoxal phosphate-dependent enzyme [Thermoanaerobaculia bacterium]
MLVDHLAREMAKLKEAGTYKEELALESPQDARVKVNGREVVMLTSNNYLGFANHPRVREAQKKAIDRWGAGMASVRFICGTETLHRELEAEIASFFGTDDAILYMSCWNANEGLFAAILDEPDGLYSDELNHASIIDGVRLCKAKRYKVPHADTKAFEKMLAEDTSSRFKLMMTDGVFSMEGEEADLRELVWICREKDVLLAVDDSHATGVLGATGRGTAEEQGVMEQIDVTTGTLGKAMGSAAGGFTTGPKALVEALRQRSRTYLFSNSLPPAVVAGSLEAFRMLQEDPAPVRKLRDNAIDFRKAIADAGFRIPPGTHPIVPVIVGDTAKALSMGKALLEEGV